MLKWEGKMWAYGGRYHSFLTQIDAIFRFISDILTHSPWFLSWVWFRRCLGATLDQYQRGKSTGGSSRSVLGKATWSDLNKVTYPQNRVSAGISATLFWKFTKNWLFGENDILTPTFRLSEHWLWQWRPHWLLEEALIVKAISSKLDANCPRRFQGSSNKAYLHTYWDIGQKWCPMIVRGSP